jgi:hypothetical protein
MTIKKEFMESMEDFKKNHHPSLFNDPGVYQEWLAQTYFFVRHSTALLGYALPFLKNDDLRHHFEKHLGEETRHDLVALKDLQKMGRDISEFRESAPTQAFYQSQYFRVQFEGGTALLGYILFLEGIAVHWGKEVYEMVKDRHKGTHFARVHVDEDPEHLEGALTTIMSLDKAQQEAIMRNFYFSKELYETIVSTAVKNNSLLKVA